MGTRVFVGVAALVASLAAAPSASAIQVGMEPTSKVLYVHGDTTNEVNNLRIYRITNAYKVVALGGPIGVSTTPGYDTDCNYNSVDTTVTCIHDLGSEPEASLPFEAIVSVGGGNDTVTFAEAEPDSFGAVKAFELHGEAGRDDLQGGALDDRIWGEDDDDFAVEGGAGADQVDGGDGNDVVDGGDGGDFLFGGAGADSLADLGADGLDTLFYQSETGLVRTGPVTLTIDHGTTGNDGGVDDDDAGLRDTIGPGIENFNLTGFDDNATGSGASERLSGSFGADTLDGGHGDDTLRGGAGNDILKAQDGVSDAEVECDSSSGNDGTADSAQVDAESVDQVVLNCESVTRAGGGDPPPSDPPPSDPPPSDPPPSDPPPSDPTEPTQPTEPTEPGFVMRSCPTELDLHLRADYDIDKVLAGKMRVQVSVPVKGLLLKGVLTKSPDEDEKAVIGNFADATAGSPGLHPLKLDINSAFRSQYAGKTRIVTVNVYVGAPGCPWLAIAHTVQLAPKPDMKAARRIRAGVAQRSGGAFPCASIPVGTGGQLNCGAVPTQPSDPNCSTFNRPNNVIYATAKCFKWPKPDYATSDGTVEMNGLIIEPVGGKVFFDREKFTFGGTGRLKIYFKLQALGGRTVEVPLYEGGAKTFSLRGNEFLAERGGFEGETEIAGFKVAANLTLKLIPGGARTTASLKLPNHFGGAQGSVALEIPQNGVVQLSSLKVKVPELNAFGFTLKEFTLEYKSAKDPVDGTTHESWFAEATVFFPGMNGGARPNFTVSMRWEDGKFVHGQLIAKDLKQVFGNQFVALQEVRGEVSLGERPKVSVDAMILFGPNVFPSEPTELARAKARLTYEAGSPDGRMPGVFTAKASVGFSFWELPRDLLAADAKFSLTYTTDGAIEFDADSGVTFGPATVRGKIEGSVAGKKFEASAKGTIQLVTVSGKGKFYANNKGAVACITGKKGAGFTFEWKGAKLDFFAGCGLKKWDELKLGLKARGAQTPARYFTVPAGTPRFGLRLRSSTGAPSGALVSPSGKRFAQTVQIAEQKTTYWLVEKPEAGRWRIDDQPPVQISSAAIAFGTPAPKIDADLKRVKDRFEVKYSSSGLPSGEQIAFYERADDSDYLLSQGGGSGTFSFKPADVHVRPRQLIALVTRDGIPTGAEVVVANFKGFPAPVPTTLFGKIRAKRDGDDVDLDWGVSGGADGYAVHVTFADGRRKSFLLKGQTNTKLRLKDVGRKNSLKVRIYGWNEDFEFGRPTTVKFKGKKKDVRKPPVKVQDPDDVGLVEVTVADIQVAE